MKVYRSSPDQNGCPRDSVISRFREPQTATDLISFGICPSKGSLGTFRVSQKRVARAERSASTSRLRDAFRSSLACGSDGPKPTSSSFLAACAA